MTLADVALLSEVGNAPPRKKRTRPVSACENCHSKKVKCLLKADEPVCQRCSSTGAECLFRIDDLSAELRMQRFSDSGPLGNNGQGSHQGTRLATSHAPLSMAKTGPGSRPAKKRRSEQGETSSNGSKPSRAKATFREFANPAKLRPPNRTLGSYEKQSTQAMPLTYSDAYTADTALFSGATQRDRGDRQTTSFLHQPRLTSQSNDYVPEGSIDRLSVSHLVSASPVSEVAFAHPAPSSLTNSTTPPQHPPLLPPHSTRTTQHMHHSIPPIDQSMSQDVHQLNTGQSSVARRIHAGQHTDTASVASQPKFERMALPFFRWFGTTANTPGIRRVKVGVYHESEDQAQGQQTSADMVVGETAAPGTASSHFSSSSHEHLFDKERPRYPRRDLLVHLVKLSLKYFRASSFPWLDEEELLAGAEAGELPAVLAHALCAVGAQISNHKDLNRSNAKARGSAFSEMAKELVVPMLSWPSLDVIEALLIISYSEFAQGADSGLWMYIGMALRMATDLGLQYEATITSMSTPKLQHRARLLFWAIVGLDRITCFGTGRSVSIREDSFDCELPALAEDPLADGLVFGHIVRVLLKRGRIGELLNQHSNDLTLEEKGKKLQTIWHDLVHYYETLPPALQFGVITFRKVANAGQGAAFVYLHVLLQSIMSLLNRPSLLRRFDKDFQVSMPSKLASVANQASNTIVSILKFAQDASLELQAAQDNIGEHPGMNPYIDCNPYLDQLVLPAGRAFLAEKEGVSDALKRLGVSTQSRPVSRGEPSQNVGLASHSVQETSRVMPTHPFAASGPFDGLVAKGQYAQMNLMTCQHMLDRLAIWWSGAEWPARALRQETIGAADEEDDLGIIDKGVQLAPVRDVEMILKWAKAARGKKTKTDDRAAPVGPSQDQREGQPDQGRANRTLGEESDAPLLAASQYQCNESNASGDSPLGLGFSGQFSTTTEFDTEAIINAWVSQGILNDVAPQTSSRWQNREPNGFAPVPLASNGTSSTQHLVAPAQTTSPAMVDLDFTTVQLEEFFRTGFEPTPYTRKNELILGQDSIGAGTGDGWDNLPSALFDAFTFHHAHQA